MVDNQTRGLIERRTVVRAGVWAAPAVAVVVAVPAYAACSSGGLVAGGFTANYRNHATPGSVDPTRIDVSSTVVNSGTTASGTFTRVLSIPGGLFDSVVSTTPPGYAAPIVTGSLAAGWTVTSVRTATLAAGATDTFSATLTVGGTTAALQYRGQQGPAFSLTGQASGGAGCGSIGQQDAVEQAQSAISLAGWVATRDSTTLRVGDTDNGGVPPFSATTGRVAGRITLNVTVPDTTGRYASAAGADQIYNNVSGAGTLWTYDGRTPAVPSGNATGPWTYTFRTTSVIPPNTSVPFRARINLTGASGSEPNTVNIGVTASLPGSNQPTAIDNAE